MCSNERSRDEEACESSERCIDGGMVAVSRWGSNTANTRKLLHTACSAWAMLSSGMSHTLMGLAFPDLMLILNRDLAMASWIFTAWSFGNMIGSLLAGLTYDRFHKLVVLVCLSAGLSVSVGAIPWCANFALMLTVHALGGGFASAIHSTVTADTLYIWGADKGSYLQIVHLAATAGGILSPFVVNPFLAKRVHNPRPYNTTHYPGAGNDTSTWGNAGNDNSTWGNAGSDTSTWGNAGNDTSTWGNAGNDTSTWGHAGNDTSTWAHLYRTDDHTNISSVDPGDDYSYSDTNIHYAYLIGSLVAIMAVGLYLTVYATLGSVYPTHVKKHRSVHNRARDQPAGLSRTRLTVFVVMLSLQIMVYTTMQRHVFGLFMTYAFYHLNWSKTDISNTLAAFWAVFCVGRVVAVVAVRRWKESVLNRFYMTTMCVGVVGFTLTSLTRDSRLITPCLLLSAFGMSPLFTYMFSWFSSHITRVTGRIIGVVYVCIALGSMTVPVITGHLMYEVSYQWFLYLLLVLLVLTLLLTTIITLVYRLNHRKTDTNTI